MTEMTLAAILENIPRVTAFVDEQLESLGCPVKARMQIDLAIDEIFGNIARYAYGKGHGDATVRFDFEASTRTVTIAFMDRGMPFNPLKRADPDVTLSAEEREIGGLGIFLVKKTMDKLEYRFEAPMNILTLYKNI